MDYNEPTGGATTAIAAPGLLAAFRARVGALHAEAERTGIVADILRRRASVAGYALLLRNLLPAYTALEDGLRRHRGSPALAPLADPDLFRAAAIAADLAALGTASLDAAALPLLAEAGRYAARIASAADGDGGLLIAHAYTRYVGDLSGGQIMRRLLAGSIGVPAAALSAFDFAALGDPDAYKARYRDAIDRAGRAIADPDAAAAEAAVAFRLNIDLSRAVQAAVAGATTPAC